MPEECPKPKWWEFKNQHCFHLFENTKMYVGDCRQLRDAEVWVCCRCGFSKTVPVQIPDY